MICSQAVPSTAELPVSVAEKYFRRTVPPSSEYGKRQNVCFRTCRFPDHIAPTGLGCQHNPCFLNGSRGFC